MCGILAAVGKPKDAVRSYELITNLIKETQKRGKDATGFHCLDSFGNFDYHKMDVKAEIFVKKSKAWHKKVMGCTSLIGHTRLKTQGTEKKEINNHPHVSDCGKLAVVHNGMISSFKAIALRKNIELKGECDSEIILRLIEQKRNVIDGIISVFEEIPYGSISCLVQDFRNEDKYVYGFRNFFNPLKYVDLKEEMGQLFFFSEDCIWEKALQKAGISKSFREKEIKSIDPYYVFKLNIDNLEMEFIDLTYLNKKVYNYSSYNKKRNTQIELTDEKKQVIKKIHNCHKSLSTLMSMLRNDTLGLAKDKEINLDFLGDDLEDIYEKIEDLISNPPCIRGSYFTD